MNLHSFIEILQNSSSRQYILQFHLVRPQNNRPAIAAGNRVGVQPGARRHLEWSASVGFAGTYEPTGAMPARMSEIVAEALRVQAGHPAVDPTADHAAWWGDGARIDADNELVELTLERGIRDLRLLVNDGPGEGQWYLSAGVPWFATLFGRDSLVTSLQTLPFYPAIAIATGS